MIIEDFCTPASRMLLLKIARLPTPRQKAVLVLSAVSHFAGLARHLQYERPEIRLPTLRRLLRFTPLIAADFTPQRITVKRVSRLLTLSAFICEAFAIFHDI